MSAKQVAPGTTLTPGHWYRITEIGADPDPSLQVGDVVMCADEEPRCVWSQPVGSDGMGAEWFADYDASSGTYRTLVNGLEEAPAPNESA